jgi:hypothetical protein
VTMLTAVDPVSSYEECSRQGEDYWLWWDLSFNLALTLFPSGRGPPFIVGRGNHI